MSSVRFTFVYDRFNRTATASLIAALEDLFADPHAAIRPVGLDGLEHVEFDETGGIREVLCLSTMTANAAKAVEIHGKLRSRWGDAFTSICGGAHAAGAPEDPLQAGFDYCCVGEGEDAIREVARGAAEGAALDSIAGLLRLEAGEVLGEERIPPVEIEHYEALPVRVQFPTYIEIGRGCRWTCSYCQTPHIHGSKERFRSPEAVERTVRRYADFGMKDFRFLLPNALGYMSEEPGVPNCGALEELLFRSTAACGGGRIFLGSFPSEVRPDYVTEPALQVLRAHVANAGLVLGGQSGSSSILDAVRRGHSIEAILRACDISRACGFEPSVDLVLGFPGETAEDRRTTLDMVEELGRRGAVTNMHFFMPLPGTALAGARPVFLNESVRRRLDRYGQQGILRGRWRRQEMISRRWVSR